MKIIQVDKLSEILSRLVDKSLSLADLEAILERFGDEWFIEDGEFKLCEKGEQLI